MWSSMIDRCEKIINGTAFTICVLLFGGVVLFSTLFSADYVPDDSPAFSGFSYDRIFYLILAAAILGLSLLTGKLCKWNIKVCFILYGMVSLVYIIAVPLEAFSDMKIVFDIAVNGFSDPEGYLSNYPNNIPLTIYTWVLTSLFGKSIVVLKLFNILFDVVVLCFLYRLSLISEDKKMVWMAGPFIPVIIYQNHIYNDVLFTALTVVLLYAVLRKKQTAWSLVAAIILLVLQFAFRSTGIIYIIAIAMYMILYERKIRKCVIYLAVTAVLIVMLNTVNTRMIKPDPTLKFPVWSWVQMGINEEEFGFQDGTHSTEWTMEDVINKYEELGPYRVLKVMAKKTIWMWSEGTYQAERYGFGVGDAKYAVEEDNALIRSLRDVENSPVRRSLENLMKAQYYVYMVLALIGLIGIRKGPEDNRRKYAMLMYLIVGFFCFYLIWEIKSRYIYCLYPVVMMYASYGLNMLYSLKKKRR